MNWHGGVSYKYGNEFGWLYTRLMREVGGGGWRQFKGLEPAEATKFEVRFCLVATLSEVDVILK
jgi:hypothetical protein